MKNLRLVGCLSLLSAILLFGYPLQTMAQVPSEYVTVKVVQTLNERFSLAIVAFPDGKVEEIDLPRIKAMGETNLKESSVTVLKILNRLRENGYELFSSSAGFADGGFYEVYVFKK